MNPDEIKLTLAIDPETGETELAFSHGDKTETYVLSREQALQMAHSITSVIFVRSTSLN